MTRKSASIKEIGRLFELLETELDELESAYELQFHSSASLLDKLKASKKARAAFKKIHKRRDLIKESITRLDK